MRKAGLLFVVAVLGGCVGSQGGEISSAEVAEGLTVLEAGPGSLSVAFRDGDHVIFAEALRGQGVHEPYASDAASPDFEMDARFLSGDHLTFWSQQGGDGWLDEQWAVDRDEQSQLPTTTESNEWMFQLATELATALPGALEEQFGAEAVADHQPELRILLAFGEDADREYALAVEEFAQMRLEEQDLIAGSGGTVTYGTNGPEDSAYGFVQNYYYIAHFIADLDYAWLCGGYHSGTRQYEWRGSAWATAHDNANHGRGPSESGMWQDGLLNYFESTASGDQRSWVSRVCSTGYDMLSNGSGHNCHDDARIQMNNFVYGSTASGTQYWCNDGDNYADYSCGTEGGHPSSDGRTRSGFNYRTRCDYTYNNTSCPASYNGSHDGCDCGCVFPDGSHADADCSF